MKKVKNMDIKNMHWVMVGLVVLVVASLFFMMGKQQIVVSNEGSPRISVSASAEKEVAPDKAAFNVAVFTEGKDAQKVQDENSVKMNKVLAALKDAGVTEKDIETSMYNLYPWEEWDNDAGKSVNKGYRLQNTLTITSYDVKKVGKLIDLAVNNGANEVNSVYFTLSTEKEKKVKDELLTEASGKAKEKAKVLADNLDVSLGSVLAVSESGYYPPIYYGNYMKAAAAESSATAISPQNVKVSLQVNVDYKIK